MANYPPKKALNVVADAPDLRDRYYQPALFPLKAELLPPVNLSILDQGREGACTGFGLAASINLLFQFQRKPIKVSARMLYEMAKRYDEWPGEDYSGSSCRGAIKGWHNTGVCHEELAPYHPNDSHFVITPGISENAKYHTIGAYYRLRPNITDFHSALSEAGVIYASAKVHKGWRAPTTDASGLCVIPESDSPIGGHAFAIVGYNQRGLWVQNSWSEQWGNNGIALWLYTDWARNIMDAWVVQVALPTPEIFDSGPVSEARATAHWEDGKRSIKRRDIEHHFVHVDDGSYHTGGRYWSDANHMEVIKSNIAKLQPDHLVIYAHGGLNSTNDSASRIAAMKTTFLDNGIYPFHFMYDTGILEELKDILLGRQERAERIAGSFGDWWDRRIEDMTRKVGRALWREMKHGAKAPFTRQSSDGSDALKRVVTAALALDKPVKIHVVGHSTGAILHAYLLKQLLALIPEITIETCSLLAPAATNELFESHYQPLLESGHIKKMSIYNLTESQELDDTVAKIYRKSLLYLVSRAYEENTVAEILGMELYNKNLQVSDLPLTFVYSCITKKEGNSKAGIYRSSSKSHGGFDNDPDTMNDVLRQILGREARIPFTKDILG